jgi:hypothetical protein
LLNNYSFFFVGRSGDFLTLEQIMKTILKNLLAFSFICLILFGGQAVLAAQQSVLANLKTAAGTQLAKGDLPSMLGGLIKVVLSLLAVVLVVILIYAGILWGFLAQGEKDKVKKAKDMIINAVIGLAIVFASYAITTFVFDRLREVSGT